jgi:hypothetical protein
MKLKYNCLKLTVTKLTSFTPVIKALFLSSCSFSFQKNKCLKHVCSICARIGGIIKNVKESFRTVDLLTNLFVV